MMSWKRAMVVVLALAVCGSLCTSCSRKKKKPVAPPVQEGSIITVPGDYATIQEGIDAASDGDAVIVSDGTYTGDEGDGLQRNKNLELRGKRITVESENGPDNCTIDCENFGRGFDIREGEDSHTIIRGFTIKNGNIAGSGSGGGGISCTDGSSPTIANCVITSNSVSGTGSAGGGINCYGSDAVIKNCTITSNSVTGSGSHGGGISIRNGAATVMDCIISNNHADTCGDGKIYDPDGHITWGDGNIYSDPLFVGGTTYDYHLQAGSLCIDAGDNPVVDWDKDLDGNARIANGAVDMGTYEK